MNQCNECQHCEMLIFDHPYFGMVEKIVCTNVLDDDIAEIPEHMLFTEKEIPCFTFRPRGSKSPKDADPPIILAGE